MTVSLSRRDARMNDQIAPPSRLHQLLEGRVGAEASWLLAQWPMLRFQAPKGQGPVMVLPGFMAGDDSTWLLRRFLGELGYDAYPWEFGINRGRMLHYLPGLIERAERLRDASGERPSLVGWSRGGTLSREVARERPDLIRSVVTMGSPVRGGVGGTSIGRTVSAQTGMTPEQMLRLLAERGITGIPARPEARRSDLAVRVSAWCSAQPCRRDQRARRICHASRPDGCPRRCVPPPATSG